MLILNEFHVAYFDYGAALINALVIGKVILIGQDLHLGRKHEAKPLFLSVVYKAFLFGLLVFGFHVVEDVIKRLLHGENIAGGFRDIRIDDLLARSVVIFCTFIPLLGFLEVRRVLGVDHSATCSSEQEQLKSLVFRALSERKVRLAGRCHYLTFKARSVEAALR